MRHRQLVSYGIECHRRHKRDSEVEWFMCRQVNIHVLNNECQSRTASDTSSTRAQIDELIQTKKQNNDCNAAFRMSST
jgi:ribosomal protein L17